MANEAVAPPSIVAAWSAATAAATHEVAVTALGCDAGEIVPGGDEPQPLDGSSIQVTADAEVVHIGVCAAPAALHGLAAALLGTPDELAHADVVDAVGEIVTMVAPAAEPHASRESHLRLAPAYAVRLVVRHQPRAGSNVATP